MDTSESGQLFKQLIQFNIPFTNYVRNHKQKLAQREMKRIIKLRKRKKLHLKNNDHFIQKTA